MGGRDQSLLCCTVSAVILRTAAQQPWALTCDVLQHLKKELSGIKSCDGLDGCGSPLIPSPANH